MMPGRVVQVLLKTGDEVAKDQGVIVVEAIADPLVHMVRNAVDHGIETPAERVKAGKRRAGRIELRASHQGGNVSARSSLTGTPRRA